MTGALVSGWAARRSFFPGLSQTLDHLIPFTESSPDDIVSRLAARRADVLLGWSTGAHIVLKAWDVLAPRYTHIVLVAPFLDFGAHVAPDSVRAMRANMDTDAERTVRAFLQRAAAPVDDGVLDAGDVQSLAAGLDFLLESRAGLPAPRWADRLILIHSQRDRIVPPAASRELAGALPGAAHVEPPGGHFVPETTIADIVHEKTGLHIL